MSEDQKMTTEVEIDYEVKTFLVDEKLMENVSKMLGEGWTLVPGTLPTATYHMMRPKHSDGIGGMKAVFTIDGSKVHILRKDGSLE